MFKKGGSGTKRDTPLNAQLRIDIVCCDIADLYPSKLALNQQQRQYSYTGVPLEIYGFSSNFKDGGSYLARRRPLGLGKKFKGSIGFLGENLSRACAPAGEF